MKTKEEIIEKILTHEDGDLVRFILIKYAPRGMRTVKKDVLLRELNEINRNVKKN